jgi:5S rRNA maturation endonuclease (ribonuclease M5)
MITVQGNEIDVDIRTELEAFSWIRPRWESRKLIAASPFRYDHTPSFFVNLETGGWHDSGASDTEWQSGGFVKLLAFLRNETYSETIDYLYDSYGLATDVSDEPRLNPLRLELPEVPQLTISVDILADYRYRSPYLGNRGITESIQRMLNIGYDKRSRAVTIPWFNADGTLGNVKYRRVEEKTFWYASGGRRLSEMVYGMNIVYERRIKRAVIVEAEIDAMSVMVCGTMGIAVGGTAFTRAKADLIRRSPLEEITIMADRDAAGQMLKRHIISELSGYMNVSIGGFPYQYKDVNDLLTNTTVVNATNYVEKSKRINPLRSLRLTGVG